MSKNMFWDFSFFGVLPLSSNTYAGQQAATYGKASGDTTGVFLVVKLGFLVP